MLHWPGRAPVGWARLVQIELPICFKALYYNVFLPTTGPCDFTLAQGNLCYEPNWPTCHFLIENPVYYVL